MWERMEGQIIQFVIDNKSVMDIISGIYSREPHLIHMIEPLSFLQPIMTSGFTVSHIEGKQNSLADALSRNNASFFLQQVPKASRIPSTIPQPLLELLAINIHSLDSVVRSYYTAGLATSTHKSYASAKRCFLAFCENFGLKPFPVSESVLCYFAACIGQQGLAHTTIKSYLSGIRQSQIAMGLPDPHIDSMPRFTGAD